MSDDTFADRDFTISPAQGLALLSIGECIRTGSLTLIGGGDDAKLAAAALIDVSQEIALQISNGEKP